MDGCACVCTRVCAWVLVCVCVLCLCLEISLHRILPSAHTNNFNFSFPVWMPLASFFFSCLIRCYLQTVSRHFFTSFSRLTSSCWLNFLSVAFSLFTEVVIWFLNNSTGIMHFILLIYYIREPHMAKRSPT